MSQFFIERIQQLRLIIGLQHDTGMHRKCKNGGRLPAFIGQTAQFMNQETMSLMNTIEKSDRCRPRVASPLFCIAYDDHGTNIDKKAENSIHDSKKCLVVDLFTER